FMAECSRWGCPLRGERRLALRCPTAVGFVVAAAVVVVAAAAAAAAAAARWTETRSSRWRLPEWADRAAAPVARAPRPGFAPLAHGSPWPARAGAATA